MGRKHNQDHYKVDGSEIESRPEARKSRQALAKERAELRRAASAKKPPRRAPQPAPAKAAARTTRKPSKPRVKAELPEIAREAHAASSVPASAMPNAAPAEVLSLRREQAARASSVAPEVPREERKSPGLFGKVRELTGQVEGLTRKGLQLAVDVATAPLTVARLLRRMRREEA